MIHLLFGAVPRVVYSMVPPELGFKSSQANAIKLFGSELEGMDCPLQHPSSPMAEKVRNPLELI
jgi:hypothetical protein